MDLSRVLDEFRRTRLGMLTGVATAGGAGLLVDTATLWLLTMGLAVPVPLAAAVGFLAGGVVNFLLNRAVFRGGGARADAGEMVRYAVLFGANTVAVAAMVPAFAAAVDYLTPAGDLALLAGKLITTVVLLPVNALLYRRWIFTAPSETAKDS